MLGALPLGAHPLAAGWTARGAESAFSALAKAAAGDGQYLVEITAYIGGEIRTGGRPGLGGPALGKWALASGSPGPMGTAGETTLLYGDRHWVGEPTDAAKPNIFYEGRVTVPLVMERAIPLLPEEPRRVQRQFGAIEIANGDGALDDPSRYAVDGRRVRVLFGPSMPSAYADFGVLADVLGAGWESGETVSRLLLRDQTYNLERRLQTTLYAGTGGAEGGAEMTGKPKPLCFGKCRNVTPVLIDPTNLVYQLHDCTIAAIDGVYDRAAALTPGSDHASYAALIAASVSAGTYATCLALGMIRLGSSPSGLITADVQGDATGGYVDDLDGVALRILQTFASVGASSIEAGSWSTAALIGGTLGLYIGADEAPSTSEVIDRLVSACGAWWGASRHGKIAAGRLRDPSEQPPSFWLDEFNVLSVEPEAAPVPRWRQRVGYQPNWTPQQTDIAASVTAARRQFLAGPERVVTWSDSTIQNRHRQATDATLGSLYDDSADAQALADDIGDLFGPDRGIWRVTLKRFGYLLDIGQYGNLTWPRHGLANGRNVAVIGIREDADKDATTIRVWG